MKEISGVRLLIVRKNKIWDQQQVRLLYCGILPSSFLVPLFLLASWFLPLASGLPGFFVFCLWCCSESEDSVNNSRIQHSNCLWYLFDFLFLVLESISGTVAIQSVLQQFVPAHLANEQATSAKPILFCGVMTPTLLLLRPGLHSTDMGLL